MEKGRFHILMFIIGVLFFSLPGMAQRGQGAGAGMGPGMGVGPHGFDGTHSCQALLSSLPKQNLDAKEAEGLIYLREEEKLARDVYDQLSGSTGLHLFENIANSEERHTDAIKALLDRYGLPDPATGAAGAFTNPGLAKLYASLVAQGKASPAAALRVGATIEDLDIHDLDLALAGTDNDDLKLVYQNLRSASRKHLRAFVTQLQLLEEKYEAQYISNAALAQILARSTQGGMGAGWGGNGQHGPGTGAGTCPWGQPPTP